MNGADARPRLAFLVGLPRSGTTWLQRLLGAHPAIGTAQESHLFNHFLGTQIRAWDHLVAFEDGRGGIGPPAYRTEAEFLAALAREVRETLSKAEEYGRNALFLEKTPDHVRHLLDIQRVLPEARIVLVSRRPADVIESMLSAGAGWGRAWAPGSIWRAIRLYRHFGRKAAEDLARADRSRLLVVRYEALKADPAAALVPILRFLDLDASPETVAAMIERPCELRLYGEFAARGADRVVEPEGFARASKGRLGPVQRLLVRLCLGDDALGGADAAAPSTAPARAEVA